MPKFLAVRNEGFQEQETLEDYFMEYESQYHRFKDHLIFQEFFHIKDNRHPGITIEVEDSFISMIYTALWADFSYPTLMGHLNALSNHG